MVIHLSGPDEYRSARRLHDLRSAFITKHDPQGYNTVTIDGATATLNDIRQAVVSTGFFSAKRFVAIDYVANSVNVPADGLNEILSPLVQNKDVIVVVRELALAKKSTAAQPRRGKSSTIGLDIRDAKKETFPELNAQQLQTWVQHELRSRQAAAEVDVIPTLIALIGTSTWRLAQEIEKLSLYAGQRKVRVEDVRQLVRGESDANIFAVTDAMSRGQQREALTALHDELEGGASPFAVLAIMATHVRNVWLIHQCRSRQLTAATTASTLGLHPFVVQKLWSQATRFSSDQLWELHRQLLLVDQQLKTSPQDAETLLDQVVRRV